MLVHQLGAGFLLVTCTLWLQSAGIAVLVAWIRHAAEGDIQKMGPQRVTALVVRFTTAVVLLHGLEILLWTSFYRWICLPTWDSAIYFSACSYSTLGCGDVVLPPNWRFFGPLESMIGVLMCGVSASLLFAIVIRLITRDKQASTESAVQTDR
ncbi:MAG TPA: ion channel [Terracidiphilus sp.]|jgi:hypothetical protein